MIRIPLSAAGIVATLILIALAHFESLSTDLAAIIIVAVVLFYAIEGVRQASEDAHETIQSNQAKMEKKQDDMSRDVGVLKVEMGKAATDLKWIKRHLGFTDSEQRSGGDEI